MSDVTVTIPERLTEARRQRGMSMREVARLADVSPACVHSWEHRTRQPSLANLHAWANALGFTLILTREART